MLSESEKLLRIARRRDFSGDVAQLEATFRILHADLVRHVEHLKGHWHDTQAKWELRKVFDLRAEYFAAITAASLTVAMRLAAEFQLVIPEVRHAAMVG